MSPNPFPAEPTADFPYRIEMQAGSGAMGVVYRAMDTVLDRPVAIKLLQISDQDVRNDGDMDEMRSRFLQEARAAAGLSHPGVTVVHRIGEIGGRPYLVMEWLEGQTLEQLLDQRGLLPLEQVAALIYDLLQVLEVAHRAGVVHRDIKPANLILLEDGRLKVTDFGIALLMGRQLVETQAGAVLATPQFASPEQLQGRALDGRSDLFAVGVLTFHLLTAELPFPADSIAELVTGILNKPPTPVTDFRPELPPIFVDWLMRAFAKDPGHRFASARDMADGLEMAVGGIVRNGAAAGAPAFSAARPAGSQRPSSGSLDAATAEHRLISPPSRWLRAAGPGGIGSAIAAVRESWESRDLGVLAREAMLDRLLETPFHAESFAGVAIFGQHELWIQDGVVVAAVEAASGRLERSPELPTKAPTRLYVAPAGADADWVSRLAGVFSPCDTVHENLDTSLIDLAGLIGRLLDEGFEGFVRIDSDSGSGSGVAGAGATSSLILLSGGRCLLAVSGDRAAGRDGLGTRDLAEEGTGDGAALAFTQWLSGLRGKVGVLRGSPAPPDFFYPRAFPATSFEIEPRLIRLDASSAKATSASRGSGSGGLGLATAWPKANLGDEPVFVRRSLGNRQQVGPARLDTAPMVRFLDWMLDGLPKKLVEQRRTEGFKYLGDWLLDIRRATLHGELESPTGDDSVAFDLVSEDGDGKILHLALRSARLDGPRLERAVEQMVAAKSARLTGGDVGGGFLISPRIESSAFESYGKLLHKGLGNRLFGLDKSMGYEGFVRLSARRGFHLLLVEETEDGFRPHFDVSGF